MNSLGGSAPEDIAAKMAASPPPQHLGALRFSYYPFCFVRIFVVVSVSYCGVQPGLESNLPLTSTGHHT